MSCLYGKIYVSILGSESMLQKWIKLITLSIVIVILGACADIELSTDETQVEQAEVTALEDLQNIENFQSGALEHILEGELNHKGQAVGFHYDELPTKKGEIIEGTETDLNELGVYEAQVIISGVEKTSNRGYSTFFPDHWDTQDVVDAINEAYEHREFISGNTYEGITSDGMIIRMYLNKSDEVISAFPIYN